MIFYNSLLAKWFLGKGKKHYFMLGWFFFTRYKYLEVWEDMELRIHAKQYWECFSLTLIPALILSLLFSWWCMILPFITYDLLYWFEKIIYHHSIFNWEAIKHSGDTLYLRKRKAYAWKKGYGKKSCPYPDGMIDSLFQMLLYPKQMSVLCIVGGPMLINRSNQGFFRTV